MTFGVPFLVLGRAALGAGCVRVVGGLPGVMNAVAAFGLGLFFTTFGGWLVFERSGVTIDRRAGMVRSWFRLLWWRRERDYDLKAFTSIALSRGWNTGRGPKWWYRIHLVSNHPEALTMQLGEQLGGTLARDQLRELTAFVDLPVVFGFTE